MVNSGDWVLQDVTAVFMALAWITVILRVYVRAWLVKSFGADDYLAVATLVSKLPNFLDLTPANKDQQR